MSYQKLSSGAPSRADGPSAPGGKLTSLHSLPFLIRRRPSGQKESAIASSDSCVSAEPPQLPMPDALQYSGASPGSYSQTFSASHFPSAWITDVHPRRYSKQVSENTPPLKLVKSRTMSNLPVSMKRGSASVPKLNTMIAASSSLPNPHMAKVKTAGRLGSAKKGILKNQIAQNADDSDKELLLAADSSKRNSYASVISQHSLLTPLQAPTPPLAPLVPLGMNPPKAPVVADDTQDLAESPEAIATSNSPSLHHFEIVAQPYAYWSGRLSSTRDNQRMRWYELAMSEPYKDDPEPGTSRARHALQTLYIQCRTETARESLRRFFEKLQDEASRHSGDDEAVIHDITWEEVTGGMTRFRKVPKVPKPASIGSEASPALSLTPRAAEAAYQEEHARFGARKVSFVETLRKGLGRDFIGKRLG